MARCVPGTWFQNVPMWYDVSDSLFVCVFGLQVRRVSSWLPFFYLHRLLRITPPYVFSLLIWWKVCRPAARCRGCCRRRWRRCRRGRPHVVAKYSWLLLVPPLPFGCWFNWCHDGRVLEPRTPSFPLTNGHPACICVPFLFGSFRVLDSAHLPVVGVILRYRHPACICQPRTLDAAGGLHGRRPVLVPLGVLHRSMRQVSS